MFARLAHLARLGSLLTAVTAVLMGAGFGAVAAASSPEWNIARIGAPRSAAGVVIAVVDTGVDASHPVFGGRVLPQIDVVGDGAEGDPHGHGTHVAGTAAGADAGCGSIGVAPDATILPVRVLDGEGEGTISDVARGIRRAADAGADVVNLSLGPDVALTNQLNGGGSDLRDAVEYAWSKGSIPVLAAGNDGLVGALLGSGYRDLHAVVVTATTRDDEAAPYATSIGSAEWGIAAPGGDASREAGRDILSSYPGRRCALLAGTSMAAPHVSGALAVLREQGRSPADAVQRLLATARDLGSENTYGAGLVDLAAAVGSGSATTDPTTPPTTAAPVTTASPAPTSTQVPSSSPTSSTSTSGGATSATTAATVDGRTTTTGATSDASSRVPADETGTDGDLATDVTIADENGDGTPVGLVLAATAALVAVGSGAAATALRLRRR